MSLRLASILLCCCLLLTACQHVEPNRFRTDARINGKPVRLVYDTGAGTTLLLNRKAKALGLKIAEPAHGTAPPGKVLFGRTGYCDFKLGEEQYHLKLNTVKLPWWWWMSFDMDGVIGWSHLKDLFVIDASTASIRSLDHLPEGIDKWSKFQMYERTDVLALEMPRPDGKKGVLEIDTGNCDGVSISPERWKEWQKTDPHAHGNWIVTFMPGSFKFLYREYTANKLALGPLVLKHVPVRKINRTEKSMAADGDVMEGSLGFVALKQLSVIVDRKNRVAYLQTKPTATNELHGAKTAKANKVTLPSTVHLRFREHEIMERAEDEYHSGKYEETVADYSKFIEMEPDNVEGHFRCGLAAYQAAASQGKTAYYTRAATELARAVQLDSGNEPAWFLRGNVAYLTHQWKDALQAYQHVCVMDLKVAAPLQIYIWMTRAQNGERAAADEELRAVFNPGDKATADKWEVKVAAFLLGNLDEAQFLRAAGDDVGRRCDAWYYAGLRHRLAGEQDAARDYFRKSVATNAKDENEHAFAAAELKTMESASTK